MLSTYLGTLVVCAAALAIGQGALALCGARRWSWLAPAVGLALLGAICWATVRLPGDGVISAIVVAALAIAAVVGLRGRVAGVRDELPAGAVVALAALAATALPFLAAGHFGILGTGFNPDMSQHLLATDRLAEGHSSQLLSQGYPLGPHAIVAALHNGLGIGLVQGFDALTISASVIASLTALAAFEAKPADGKLGSVYRVAGALVVGLAYMAASYFAQGSFKETMMALFLLAFALALREVSKPDWQALPLRFVPAALIAAGAVYAYSYPALVWLAGAAALWLLLELTVGRKRSPAGGRGRGGVEDAPARSAPPLPRTGPAAGRSVLWAFVVFAVLVAPEINRMLDFQSFETFDPDGPGLGNLFERISPFETLGIWPSGDFRLTPGAGAVPAVGYYLGAAFAGVLLVYGLFLCWRRRETALLAGVAAGLGVIAIAELSGTPYQAAKAIVIAAPLAAVVILVPLIRRPAGMLYVLAAAGCSLLVFANAPVGPADYSRALTGLRPAVADGSTLFLGSDQLLEEEEGVDYVIWELRGGRVCVALEDTALRTSGGVDDKFITSPPAGVRYVVTESGERSPPFAGMRLRRSSGPYLLWETTRVPRGHGDCPLIAVRQARSGSAR